MLGTSVIGNRKKLIVGYSNDAYGISGLRQRGDRMEKYARVSINGRQTVRVRNIEGIWSRPTPTPTPTRRGAAWRLAKPREK